MPGRKCFLIFITVFITAFFTGGNGLNAAVHFNFENWTVEQGLPQNSILCILQAESGYLWLGTRSGLVRFDGVEFRVFNRWNTPALEDDRIGALYEDKNGVLWVGSGSGLTGMENGTFTAYSTPEGLSDKNIRVIAGSGAGDLLVGTANGLNCFKDGRFEVIDTGDNWDDFWGNSITAIAPGRDGQYWIGTDSNGLYKLEYKLEKGKYSAVETAPPLPDGEIVSLLEDNRGRLWVGTDSGLYRLEKDTLVSPAPTGHKLREITIRSLMQDSGGAIWIGTDGEGLYRFSDGSFKPVPAPRDLSEDFIYAITEDREGNCWLGTYTNGLVRAALSRVVPVTTQEGLPQNLVRTLIEDKQGRLWVGTDRKGIAAVGLDAAPTRPLDYIKLEDRRITSLGFDRGGDLWVGTRKSGLARIRDGRILRFYTRRDGLLSDEITAIFPDSAGNLWIGTPGGLNRFEKEMFVAHPPRNSSEVPYIRVIVEKERGVLWVGTRRGLMQLKSGILKAVPLDRGSPVTDDILALRVEKNGALRIGTNGSGLLSWNKGNLTRYTTRSGLPDNYIFSILDDDAGFLWMSSYHGIFRVSKEQLDTPVNKPGSGDVSLLTPLVLDEKDGMKSSECVTGGQPSAWKTSDGKLCFPTVKGAAIVDPAAVKVNRLQPSVIIQEVFADNQPVPRSAELHTDTRMMEFYFTALSFTAPGKVKIRYQLEGFDDGWHDIQPRQKRAALYFNLEPGHYRFRVIACNSDGTWNETGAAFPFDIGGSFLARNTLWLITGLVISILGAAFLIMRSRKKRVPEIHPTTGAIPPEDTTAPKYQTSALLPETVDDVLPRLLALMDNEKVFLAGNISLKGLAERLNVHYNHLSQIINEKVGLNFNDFINKYRIDEAQKLLKNPAHAKKTILEIAYETGFYSKSVFNTAFKKFTGMTPSQFRKDKKNFATD